MFQSLSILLWQFQFDLNTYLRNVNVFEFLLSLLTLFNYFCRLFEEVVETYTTEALSFRRNSLTVLEIECEIITISFWRMSNLSPRLGAYHHILKGRISLFQSYLARLMIHYDALFSTRLDFILILHYNLSLLCQLVKDSIFFQITE